MGRKPTVNLNLPPRLRVKTMASGKRYYYYDMGGKPRVWQPLGSDYILALKQYADLEVNTTVEQPLFKHAAKRYMLEVAPTKAYATQRNFASSIKFLNEFFGDAPLDEIRPVHIAQFLDWRKDSPSSANRCISLFSIIFNHARRWGMTDAQNPCIGIGRHKEAGRDAYIDNALFEQLYEHASQPLRDFLDLLYLTGQRPADVLKFDERDIKDGAIHVTQNKTKKRLRIAIIGKLEEVIERIRERKRGYQIIVTKLIVNAHGQPMSYQGMHKQFLSARRKAGIDKADFQMRDLRAKAGTDKEESDGIKAAQDQLGHADESMTRDYVRNRIGKLVNPTK
jgi:integrase